MSKQLKNINDTLKAKGIQLSVFDFIDSYGDEFSSTIELYDAIPKYFSKKDKIATTLEPRIRNFRHRDTKYELTITPAVIKLKNNTFKYIFPGLREELIEDALRKMAYSGQGVLLNGESGLSFTLYELQKELEDKGHKYNINQVKESIAVCSQSNMILTTEGGEEVLTSSLFAWSGMNTRDDVQKYGKKSKAYIQFNPLVTESIKKGTFRQFNYDKCMGYKKEISRKLHKKIAHNYTQASFITEYKISLSRMINDFGLTKYDKISNNIREIEAGLREMEKENILTSYKIEKVKEKNKIIEANISIRTGGSFNRETKATNAKMKEVEQKRVRKQLAQKIKINR